MAKPKMQSGNAKQSDSASQSQVNGILWKKCNAIRGAVDLAQPKIRTIQGVGA